MYACRFALANVESAINAYSHALGKYSDTLQPMKRERIEAMIWIASWQRERLLELMGTL